MCANQLTPTIEEIVNTATLGEDLAFRRYIQRQLRAAEKGEAINKAIFGPAKSGQKPGRE